jgi:hypothetical protein
MDAEHLKEIEANDEIRKNLAKWFPEAKSF